jgi:hypothetical protein
MSPDRSPRERVEELRKAIRRHDHLYYAWKMAEAKDLHVVHIDPHCDLFGALMLDDGTMCDMRDDPMNEGNFLIRSVKEGIVRRLSWVFDDYGDRRHDELAIVYEHDPLMRLPWVRAKAKRLPRFALPFQRIQYSQWTGMPPDAHLSLDWDHFAFLAKDVNSIDAETEAFLARDWAVIPPMTCVCYSQNCVHASSIKFLDFANRLAQRFDAELVLFLPDREGYGPPHEDLPRTARIARELRWRVGLVTRRAAHKVGLHYA